MRAMTALVFITFALQGCKQDTSTSKTTAAPETPKPQPAAPAPSPEKALVEKVVLAAGGLDALKQTVSARIETEGLNQGVKYRQTTYREGPKRLRKATSREDVTVSDTDCWNAQGELVVECSDAEREALTMMLAATHLTRLYPLQEDRFTLKLLDAGTVAGMAVKRLEVTSQEMPAPVVLSFDEKHLLVQFEYATTLEDKKGLLVSTFADFRDVQGVKFPYHTELRFDGKVQVDEKVAAISFGKIEDDAFTRPPSFRDGEVKEKKVDDEAVAYAEHKGTLEKLADTLRDLRAWIDRRGFVVTGPVTFAYEGGAPEDPNQIVTAEVWIPISLQPGAEEVKEGTLGTKTIPGSLVAYTYHRGPYGGAMSKLGLAQKWAQDKSYRKNGAVRQVLFHDPTHTPEDRLVCELRVPVTKEPAPAPVP